MLVCLSCLHSANQLVDLCKIFSFFGAKSKNQDQKIQLFALKIEFVLKITNKYI